MIRNNFGITYLMFGMGENHGQVNENIWSEVIKTSGVENIPNLEMQNKLIEDLQLLNPKFIASGHGPCIKII